MLRLIMMRERRADLEAAISAAERLYQAALVREQAGDAPVRPGSRKRESDFLEPLDRIMSDWKWRRTE